MVEAIGIDIVQTARIRKSLARHGERFLRRVLGPDEIAIYRQRVDKEEFVAGRFAAKEAVIKALGRYTKDRPPLNNLQILNDNTGQPELALPENLREKLARVRCLVSISHDRNSAVGMAVFTEEK